MMILVILMFREFFDQYMPKERISVALRNILIEALKKEHHYKDDVRLLPVCNTYIFRLKLAV